MRSVVVLIFATITPAGCGASHRAACQPTHGQTMTVPLLGRFVALGKPPVELDVGNAGDLRHGRAIATRNSDFPGWLAVKTLWFTVPSFKGGFRVRVERLDGTDAAGIGSQPPGGVFTAPAGPTGNMLRGWRNFPSGTWVKQPGCYEWAIAGRGFRRSIVVRVQAP